MLHIEYPICLDNSSYCFQGKTFLFYSSIVHIFKLYKLCVFFFCKMLVIEHNIFPWYSLNHLSRYLLLQFSRYEVIVSSIVHVHISTIEIIIIFFDFESMKKYWYDYFGFDLRWHWSMKWKIHRQGFLQSDKITDLNNSTKRSVLL